MNAQTHLFRNYLEVKRSTAARPQFEKMMEWMIATIRAARTGVMPEGMPGLEFCLS